MRGGGAASQVKGLSNPAMVPGYGPDAWPLSSCGNGCGEDQEIGHMLPPAMDEDPGRLSDHIQQPSSGDWSPQTSGGPREHHARPLLPAAAASGDWAAAGQPHAGAEEASDWSSEPHQSHWPRGAAQEESSQWEQRPALQSGRRAQPAQASAAAPKLAPWGSRAAAAPPRQLARHSATAAAQPGAHCSSTERVGVHV